VKDLKYDALAYVSI